MMSFLKNILKGNQNRPPIDDKTIELDADFQQTDLFEGGHNLTALDNTGSSLTTLWSSCGLHVKTSKENIECQSDSKSKANKTKDMSGTAAK